MKRNFYVSIVVVLFSIFIFAAEGAADYYIAYWSFGHRVYEGDGELNRFGFALRDDVTGEYPMKDIVRSVELTDEDGTSVPLDNLRFWSEQTMFGGYDAENGQWWYGDFEFSSGHSAEVPSELIPGRYYLTVTDINDNTYTYWDDPYVFHGLVDLPIISSRWFWTYKDKFKNFVWKWKVPYHLDPTLETSVRAAILIYDKKDNNIGSLWTRVPIHLGCLIVPRDVMEKISAIGKRYTLQINLRTNDQNNRSYSKQRRTRLFKRWYDSNCRFN
jgi:hypothetical protein